MSSKWSWQSTTKNTLIQQKTGAPKDQLSSEQETTFLSWDSLFWDSQKTTFLFWDVFYFGIHPKTTFVFWDTVYPGRIVFYLLSTGILYIIIIEIATLWKCAEPEPYRFHQIRCCFMPQWRCPNASRMDMWEAKEIPVFAGPLKQRNHVALQWNHQ